MMNYTTPEEIITYLPKEIRESESKEELLSNIIRGYRRLKLPQSKRYKEDVITITTSNYSIPNTYRAIISVELIFDNDGYYSSKQVYYSGLQNDLCADINICNNCELSYSIIENILRLPQEGMYRIIYEVL